MDRVRARRARKPLAIGWSFGVFRKHVGITGC
jgi:hypothetical protein